MDFISRYLFLVRPAWAQSNGWKSRVRVSSAKHIAKSKGVLGDEESEGRKDCAIAWGGLTDVWKHKVWNMIEIRFAVRKVIVPSVIDDIWEGLNFKRWEWMNVTDEEMKYRPLIQ